MAETIDIATANKNMVDSPVPTAIAPPTTVDGVSDTKESIDQSVAPNTPPPSVRAFNKPAATKPTGLSFEQDPSGYLRAKVQTLILWENRRNSALVLVGTLSFLILTQYYSLLQIAAGLFFFVTGLNWIFVIIHKQGQKYISGKAPENLTNPHSDRLRYNGSYVPRERVVHLAQLSVDVFEVIAQQITKLVLIENSCRSAVALGISFMVWTLAKYVSTKYLFGFFILSAFTCPRLYLQHQAVIDAHVQKSLQQAQVLSEKYGGLAYNKAKELSQQATGFVKQQTAKVSAATSKATTKTAATVTDTSSSSESNEKKDN